MTTTLHEMMQSPTKLLIMKTEKDFRIELPYDKEMSNVYYLGITAYENWSTSSHFHDHFELCFLDSGQGHYKIEENLYQFNQDEIIMTKPREIHYGLAGSQLGFRLYYIGFKLSHHGTLESEFYKLGLHRVVKDHSNLIKPLFDLMFAEIQSKPYLSVHMVESLFLQMLVNVLRLFHETTLRESHSPKPLPSPIIELMNKLHREIRYDHDIARLAKDIHISRTHLSREFKRVTGITIGDYICVLCLDKAKYELSETDKPVTLIAEELHFTSIHTFSIFFKRMMQCAPTTYRKRSHGEIEINNE